MSRTPVAFKRVALAGSLGLLCASVASVAALASRPALTTVHKPMSPLSSITLDGAVLRTEVATSGPTPAALRPAPLPDRDVAAPAGDTLTAETDASLAPGLFNPQSHFAGDGYAPGSSIDADHNHRHSTGGGMNLSIPMQ